MLSVFAAAVPGSGAALTARLTNSANTSGTAPYFTCAAAITANSPRVYYKLDETGSTTTADDSSGQNRDGTYRGAHQRRLQRLLPRHRHRRHLQRLHRIHQPGQLTVGTHHLQHHRPVQDHQQHRRPDAGFGSAATGSSPTVDRVLYLTNTGALVFGNNNAAKATIAASGPYRDGQWHHVMATVGPGGMRLYVDGAQAASSSATATAAYTGYFRVGYDNLSGWPNAPSSNFFNGTLDEVAAYSTTLTATDAINHWTAGNLNRSVWPTASGSTRCHNLRLAEKSRLAGDPRRRLFPSVFRLASAASRSQVALLGAGERRPERLARPLGCVYGLRSAEDRQCRSRRRLPRPNER